MSARHPATRGERRAQATRDARKRDTRAARKAAAQLVSWKAAGR